MFSIQYFGDEKKIGTFWKLKRIRHMEPKQKTTKETEMKQCRTILDMHTQEQCSNQTNKSYDYQYGKGSMPMENIAICDDCLEEVDTTAHLHFKPTERK